MSAAAPPTSLRMDVARICDPFRRSALRYVVRPLRPLRGGRLAWQPLTPMVRPVSGTNVRGQRSHPTGVVSRCRRCAQSTLDGDLSTKFSRAAARVVREPSRAGAPRSGPGDWAHRVKPDHDRRPGVERELVANVATPEQLAEERSF